MFNSINKLYISFITFLVTAIFVLMFFLNKHSVITDNLFSYNNIVVLILIILVSSLLVLAVNKIVTFPINKITKNIKNILDKKVFDIKYLKDYSKLNEIKKLTEEYIYFIEYIQKNNFDLTNDKSKTEIILENMRDGVIAFSLDKSIIHINKSAKELLDLP
ncbi:MAG: hypothetical protein RSC92_03110, partial [Clostridia bacterium]